MSTCEQCQKALFEKGKKYGQCSVDRISINRQRPICQVFQNADRWKPKKQAANQGQQTIMEGLRWWPVTKCEDVQS